MHIPVRDQCNWLRERIETAEPVRTNPPKNLHSVQHAFEGFTGRNNKYLCTSRAQLHPSAYAHFYSPSACQMQAIHASLAHALLCPAHTPTYNPLEFYCLQIPYTPERKLHMLDRLAWSEMFESFLANKYTAAKRFGLEARLSPMLPSRACPHSVGRYRHLPMSLLPQCLLYGGHSNTCSLKSWTVGSNSCCIILLPCSQVLTWEVQPVVRVIYAFPL